MKSSRSKINKLLQNSNDELTDKIQLSNNPYLSARFEWNALFGDIRKSKQQWLITAYLSLGANVLLIIGMIMLSLQTHIVPYVIKVDQLGNALNAGFLDKEKKITPLEVNAFLRQYLINARSVITDPFAEKRAIDFVYSASLPPTRKILDTFYRETNPFVTAKQELVEVDIQGVIQKSACTWQINWIEIHRGLDGDRKSVV
jgi:type IV secretion system protein VirB5